MLVHFGAQAAFLACGLTALGLIIIATGVVGALPGRGSLKWPSTEGEILSSEVAFDPMSGRERAQLRYRYTVDGKSYTGSRVTFNGDTLFSAGSGEARAAEVQRSPAGQAVRVYYDPADPARSVLVPGSGPQSMIPIGIGGLFFVLGLISGILAIF